MSKKIKLFTVLVVLASLLCAAQSFAQSGKPVTLKADTIVYDSTTGISTAEGNVVIIQEDGQATAQRAEYNMNTQVGWLEGGVVATKGEVTLTANRVWLRDRNHVTAEGSATFSKAGDSISSSVLDYWSDREFAQASGGGARLTQKDGSVLTAQNIEYDMKNGLAVAQNNVEINSPPRNLTGAGDKATYTAGSNGKPGEFVLSGNAWIIQDGNKIVGNSLIIKSDSSSSAAKGNVRMDIQPRSNQEKEQVVTEDNKTDTKQIEKE